MRKEKGTVFITVIILSMIIVFVGLAASNMILRDTHIIKHLKVSTQALHLAEAGISDALSYLAANGFGTGYSSGSQSLGEGAYSVDVDDYVVGGTTRYMITSVGTVSNFSRTVKMEIKGVSLPIMSNALSAGNNITLKSQSGDITVRGDIHANNDILLKELGNPTSIDVQATAEATGKVTSSGDYDIEVNNGSVTIADLANSGGNKPRLGMPIFNFAYFKSVAQTDGNYITGPTSFNSEYLTGGTAGIIYVNGDVRFTGTCTITGGFVAYGDITLNNGNSLTQSHDAGNRFPIFMSEAGSRMKIYGQFTTAGNNIVYATNDIQIETPGGTTRVLGTVIAGGSFSITANNDLELTYGAITSSEVVPLIVEIVSWNR